MTGNHYSIPYGLGSSSPDPHFWLYSCGHAQARADYHFPAPSTCPRCSDGRRDQSRLFNRLECPECGAVLFYPVADTPDRVRHVFGSHRPRPAAQEAPA